MPIKTDRKLDVYFEVALIFLVFTSASLPIVSNGIRAILFLAYIGYVFVKSFFYLEKVPVSYCTLFIGFAIYVTLSKYWAATSVSVEEMTTNMWFSILLNISTVLIVIFSEFEYETFSKIFVCSSFVLFINVIFSYSVDSSNRLDYGDNANLLGMAVATFYAFLLYRTKKNKDKQIFYIIIVVCLLVVVFLTGSRKALMGLIVYTCCLLLFEKYSSKSLFLIKKIAQVVAVAAVILIIIMKVDIFYRTIGNRLESLLTYEQGIGIDSSAYTRDMMKEIAFDLFKEKPWFGHGLNSFKYISRYDTYSHNNYLELLSGVGIVGAVLYYLPVVVSLFTAIKLWIKNKKDMILPIAILIVFMIGDLGGVSYITYFTHLTVGLAVGFIIKTDVEEKKRQEENLTGNKRK